MRYYLLLLILLVAACQSIDPSNFGMTEAEWHNLSEKEQTEYRRKYSDAFKIHNISTHKKYTTQYPRIEVKMAGTALMWPEKRYYPFNTIKVNIDAGTCVELKLTSTNNKAHTDAEACYDGLQLAIDPSHWQLEYAKGGLIIPVHHLWQQGMSYQALNSSGYAMLKHTNVFVRSI